MVEIRDELVWFITGCSSGFGHELVLAALARGDCVIATARDPAKLSSLPPSPKLHLMQVDVTEGFPSLQRKLTAAAERFGRLDVVVNNAGMGVRGFFEERGSDATREQFAVNVFGLLDVTNAALPHLRARRSGTIVYLGSRSSWRETPSAGNYCASKAAVRVLAESMNAEIAQFGIRSLILEPGAFKTGVIPGKIPDLPRGPAGPIADYDPLADAVQEAANRINFKGDPRKAMELLVDVVKGEGKAKGKKFPLHLPLGVLGEEGVKDKLKIMQDVLEEWGPIIRDLDFDAKD
ncbi:NAD-P-binding protein [Epithele typhae]|uniref:NAD-P-binding protein n=1 Tax=Epithele typhae TaxID=378194 RepID=UPI002008C247|nr:NAD-P-binding protein [Epithele typhae]KAH9941811.1 NAD-P-binding protein [Epithele typhae]